MIESAAARPFSAISNGSAWQLTSSVPANTAKAQRHALCEYMPLRPCAIYDLCKTRFTSRVGGITAIYHCVFIHSAFELGGYGGKVTIYLRNHKGNVENYFEEGGRWKC